MLKRFALSESFACGGEVGKARFVFVIFISVGHLIANEKFYCLTVLK